MSRPCCRWGRSPPWRETIGWRTDGSGSYPKAQPPLEWSPTKNVVWCTPMPGYGVSHPVLLGRRVFICSEPATLLCLDREDGKILWQKTSSYAELEIDAGRARAAQGELAETAELNQEAVGRPEGDGCCCTALSSRTRRRGRRSRRSSSPSASSIEESRRRKQKLTLAVRYTQPDTHPAAGYSAPTPVTNGKDVFVAFGNGLVACFDLDGNRKWLKLIEHSNAPFAHSGSPILAGDKLLIHFTDLVALDPKTGNECLASQASRRATARPWQPGSATSTSS